MANVLQRRIDLQQVLDHTQVVGSSRLLPGSYWEVGCWVGYTKHSCCCCYANRTQCDVAVLQCRWRKGMVLLHDHRRVRSRAPFQGLDRLVR